MNVRHSGIRLFVATVALLITVAAAQTTQKPSPEPGKTVIILDASGSMWGQIEGKAKIDIARDVVTELMANLDPELELGLMAYGHRKKGDCTDIELLIPPSKGDRAAFLAKVMGLMPKGKTPLTDAVEMAAEYLKIEENAANIILVSDGLETCDRDPCALAQQLAAKGIAFKTHIVAFDLTSDEADSIRCLADETGGEFLQAQDAATLQDALEMAVEAVSVAPAPDKPVMPEEKLDPATLKAPAEVPAGSVFEVEWEGPNNKGDFITIIAKGAEDRKYGNYAYTRNGSPSKLTATMEPGPHEVRYFAGKARKVLGRVDITVTPVEAMVKGPAEVVAGSHFDVEWTGPNNKGDYVTIVAKGAEEGTFKNYAYTDRGNPLKVRALPEAGEAELRYISGQGAKTLARAAIKVLEASVSVTGPESVNAGSEVTVAFIGPKNKGDYITVVKQSEKDGSYKGYAYATNEKDGKVSFKVPEEAGDDYEIRYVAGQGALTLARSPIKISPVTASIVGPESAVAGSPVKFEWTGPKNNGDYLTIVAKDAKVGVYKDYVYASKVESPAQVSAIETPGEAEIRYVSAGKNILASAPLLITEATATLKVPAEAVGGSEVLVEWTGPANQGDYIDVAVAGSAEKKYSSYAYAKESPARITLPEKAGSYDIRYVTAKEKNFIARATISVVAATAKLTSVPEKMVAGEKVEINWEGPNNKNDYINIVKEEAEAKASSPYYCYTKDGGPKSIKVPKEPGIYEARYMTGRDKQILARQKVEVIAE